MMIKNKLLGIMLAIPMAQAAAPAISEEAPFTYSDDWRLVSAPPPPGPYTAVNIDPRVPRQEAIPAMTTSGDAAQPWQPLPAEVIESPPAAGTPVYPPETRQTRPRLDRDALQGPAPVPGAYESTMPVPDYRMAEPSRMPAPPQHSGYGSMPPAGYYRPQGIQHEQEEVVPPPPVYDAMGGESAGVYREP